MGPARRAVRIDVAAELARPGSAEETLKATSFRHVAIAVAILGLGLALTSFSAHEAGIDPDRAMLAPIGFLSVSVAGAVMMVGVTVPRLLATAERHITFKKAANRLALSNLRREPRRTAVMAIALGFAMGVGFITASFKAVDHRGDLRPAQRQPHRCPGVEHRPQQLRHQRGPPGPGGSWRAR